MLFVIGTQGWMAPEMMDDQANATRAIDIFSAGCMFYYCITEGHHPFGDVFSRQANIVKHFHDMKDLADDSHEHLVSRHLIQSMVSAAPDKRPSAEAVLLHPFFWNHARELAFLQVNSFKTDSLRETTSIPLYFLKMTGNELRTLILYFFKLNGM